WCAVLLWQYHEQGEEGALETLLGYNLEDVVHLPTLLALVYNSGIQRLPFTLPQVAPPSTPAIPFGFNEALIYRALAETGRGAGFSNLLPSVLTPSPLVGEGWDGGAMSAAASPLLDPPPQRGRK
ncbi:MAG: hypothetical protein HYZ72_12575, partial [Deltaproteobacteria bacterium]|nr:hypothetical protein [Deltaproteobacteria bacterium]